MACTKQVTGCISTRYCLAFLLMGVIIHVFTLRSNFSIIVVAMDQFSWDPITQGRIIGAYSYGHVFSQVMGGFLEARFGGKKVLGLSILLSSVLTLLTPAAAVAGEWWLFVVRMVVGFVQTFSLKYHYPVNPMIDD
uniref:Major facilitator superfamily (MFS) profile domain-containing protein n=1 Tax=Branchiostoma floridae TaxID=7739 RepID=C3YFX6_BRAFL|eukprot:XP_002604771.1 hypothetical protein BRAFLDRAFT_70620 [Branchiostoma floridae]